METCPQNQNEQQKVFFIPIFIHLLQLWTYEAVSKSNEKPERATTSNEKQSETMKSNKKQKRTSELEKPKLAIKDTKSPSGNQATMYEYVTIFSFAVFDIELWMEEDDDLHANDPLLVGRPPMAMLLWLCGYICFYVCMSRRTLPTSFRE